MSFRINGTAVYLASAVTFVIGGAGGYWLARLGPWPSAGVGLFFATTVFAALTFARRTDWPHWSQAMVVAYTGSMGVVLILLGVLMAITLDPPTSTVLMIVGIVSGLLNVAAAVFERRRMKPQNRRD